MEKVAIACTGGGTKASVNIGVIRALEELNIEIEAISGASMGAVIAFLYTCGYSPKEMLNVLETVAYKDKKFKIWEKIIAVPRLLIKGGGKKPHYLYNYIRQVEEERKIEKMSDVKIPFIVPALDISKREVVYFSSRPIEGTVKYYCESKVSEALECSGSLPLLYNPKKLIIDDEIHFMLDGGILTNTLITPLKEYSDFVIGVSNKFYPKQRKRVNLFTGFVQTFQSMRRTFLKTEREQADLWIECDLKTNDFSGKREEMKKYEEIGYQAAMKCFKKQKIFDKG